MNTQNFEFYLSTHDFLTKEFKDSCLRNFQTDPVVVGLIACEEAIDGNVAKSKKMLKLIGNEQGYKSLAYAKIAMVDKNVDEALMHLEKGLKEDSKKENKWLRLELYDVYSYAGSLEKSKLYLDEVLIIDPEFIPALIRKYLFVDPSIHYSEMIQKLTYVENHYKSSDVYYLLGVAYYFAKDFKKAKENFLKCTLIVDDTECFRYLAIIEYRYLENMGQAEFYFNKSIEVDPYNVNSYIDFSWFLLDIYGYEEANKTLQKLINKDSSNESFIAIIYLQVLNKHYGTAQDLLIQMERQNGSSFQSEGLRLVIDTYNSEVLSNELSNRLIEYEKKYSDEEVLWLEGIFKDLRN